MRSQRHQHSNAPQAHFHEENQRHSDVDLEEQQYLGTQPYDPTRPLVHGYEQRHT
jgi:hypothetical protein